MAGWVARDGRSGTFTFGLVAAVLLTALASAALLLPIATCPACPPNIFSISTNVTVPGTPITDAVPLSCLCGGGGRLSLFNRWRFRHWRSTLVY